MPVNTREIIDLLSQLSEEEKLRVSLKESFKGALIAGASAATGGLLLGPVGLAIGGILGSCGAALAAKDFSSVVQIITRMEPEKKECLAQNIRSIMTELNVTDVAPFAAMIAGDTALRNRVLGELVGYLRTELSMIVVDH